MPDFLPQRPSDALKAAIASTEENWVAGAKGRLESPEVQILMALRSLGWDVVRRNSGLGEPDRSQSADHE